MTAAPVLAWHQKKPVPIAISPDQRSLLDRLERLWNHRTCFICDRRGMCSHREYDAGVAYLDAEDARMRRNVEAKERLESLEVEGWPTSN